MAVQTLAQAGSSAFAAAEEGSLGALLRTARVRAGPFVRHCMSAVRGRWTDKRVRRAPEGLPVTVRRPDGFLLAGRLYAPPAPAGPGIVIAHGWDPQGQRHGLYVALADALAGRGYTVLTFNLRGYPGSDRPGDWAGFTIDELAGDVVAVVDWLRARPGVDPGRVALLGHSYGADLVIPALVRDPVIWRAVIYGPSSWMDATTTGPAATHRAFYHERYWRYMTVGEPIPLRPFLALTERLYIPNQVAELGPDHPPILLVDGGSEDGSTLVFSALVRCLLDPEPEYYTVPGTDHFCNTAAFGDVLVEDRRAVADLADRLDRFFSADGATAGSPAPGRTGAIVGAPDPPTPFVARGKA